MDNIDKLLSFGCPELLTPVQFFLVLLDMVWTDQEMLVASIPLAGKGTSLLEHNTSWMEILPFANELRIQAVRTQLGLADILFPFFGTHGSKSRATKSSVSCVVIIQIVSSSFSVERIADTTLFPSGWLLEKGVD